MNIINKNNNKDKNDILDVIQNEEDSKNLIEPQQIGLADKKALAGVGVLIGSESRSATMVVRDRQPQPIYTLNNSDEFEMLPIFVALKRYEWLEKQYSFKAVARDFDEITEKCAADQKPIGFFIHVKKDAKVILPCQTAMYMASNNLTQIVHNIVILEENSQLELITGCMTETSVKDGRHLAVEEHYIGKNAKLTSTMVHSWGSGVMVFPHTGTIVGENGRYESNYISLRAAKQVKMNPQTYLNGKGASTKYLTVVLGTPGSFIDTGGNVYMNAEGTSAELLHRGVCTGGIMHQSGLVIANAPCKGHVDCASLLLDTAGKGYVQSIPGVESHHPDARLSHEASIGKIAPEQVEYLMSRGMKELEAISMIIRGFLGTGIEGLGAELDAQIAEIAEIAGHGEK